MFQVLIFVPFLSHFITTYCIVGPFQEVLAVYLNVYLPKIEKSFPRKISSIPTYLSNESINTSGPLSLTTLDGIDQTHNTLNYTTHEQFISVTQNTLAGGNASPDLPVSSRCTVCKYALPGLKRVTIDTHIRMCMGHVRRLCNNSAGCL